MYSSALWDGRPDDPGKSGWHWIEDADGLRPLLWRGGDWPDSVDRDEWQDGPAVLSVRDLRRGRYHGPVVLPSHLAALFQMRVLAGAI